MRSEELELVGTIVTGISSEDLGSFALLTTGPTAGLDVLLGWPAEESAVEGLSSGLAESSLDGEDPPKLEKPVPLASIVGCTPLDLPLVYYKPVL